MKNILKKGACILLAGTYIFTLSSCGKKDKIEEEPVIIQGNDNLIDLSNSIIKEHNVGQYVMVTGKGNETYNGTGKMGNYWDNKKMIMVEEKKDSMYPYACAIIDNVPSSEDIMGWFDADSLMPACEVTTEYLEAETIENEDGSISYIAPVGYKLHDNGLCERKIISYNVYSDDSIEDIQKKYGIK